MLLYICKINLQQIIKKEREVIKMYVVYLYDDENREADFVGIYNTEKEARQVSDAINRFSEEECYNSITCYCVEAELNKTTYWLWSSAKEYLAD
jgi:hypothetical protein